MVGRRETFKKGGKMYCVEEEGVCVGGRKGYWWGEECVLMGRECTRWGGGRREY